MGGSSNGGAIAWSEGASGDWSNGANWTGAEVPNASDDAIVNSYGQNIAVTISQPESVGALTVISQSVTNDGSLTVGSALTLDDAILSGSGNISAGSLALIGNGAISGADDLAVSGSVTGAGSITVANNMSVGVDLSLAGSIQGGGSLTVTGATTIGAGQSSQSYTIDFAAETFVGAVSLGSYDTLESSGYLVIDGALSVGADDDVVVSNGGKITLEQSCALGGDGSNDGVRLEGGADLKVIGSLTLGDRGALSISGGYASVSGGLDGTAWSNGASQYISAITGYGALASDVSAFAIGVSGGDMTIAGNVSGSQATIAADESLTVTGAFDTSSAEVGSGGALKITGTFDNGSATLAARSSLEIDGASNASVDFQGVGATLTLGDAAAFSGSITGMSPGDTIDLVGVGASTVSVVDDLLTITLTGGGTLSFAVSGDELIGTAPALASDGHGGTLVEWTQTPPSWLLGASGNWEDASHWVAGEIPGSSGDATINSYGQSISVTIGQAESLGGLTIIDQSVTNDVSLNVGSSLSLIDASLIGAGNISAGSLALNGTLSGADELIVAGDVTGSGSIATTNDIAVGGALTAGSIGGARDLSVDDDMTISGSVTVADNVSVGVDLMVSGSMQGGGALTVAGAATFGAGQWFASNTIEFGSETFKGSLSLGNYVTLESSGNLTVYGLLSVGNTNDMLIANGGTITLEQSSALGDDSADVGVQLNDGADLTVNGSLTFGDRGALTISGGVATISGRLSGNSYSAASAYYISSITGFGTITSNISDFALNVTGGALAINGTVSGSTATVTADDTLTISGAFDGGSATIGAGASMTVAGAFNISTATLAANDSLEIDGAANGTVDFAGADETLVLGAAAHFTGSIAGFDQSDEIDLKGVVATGLSYNATTLTVDVSNGGALTLDVAGDDLLASSLALASDGHGGTLIEWAACFLRGTRIRLARGDVAIEDIAAGDLAVVASGQLRPVKWVGRRRLKASRHPRPHEIWPVVVEAEAFAPGAPTRELWLSPGHNVALEGALMPISALVNGGSIRQVVRESFEYWHVELDSHDILFAEDLPSESYLDVGNRAAFENGADPLELHPNFASSHGSGACLPLVSAGEIVERVRARLVERARALNSGFETEADDDLHVIADGRRYEPTWRDKSRTAFELPTGARAIALASRSFIPALDEPGNTDVRTLGVCLKAIELDGEAFALAGEALHSGWHEYETRGNRRWTDGLARLPAGVRKIEIEFAARGYYRSESRAAAV